MTRFGCMYVSTMDSAFILNILATVALQNYDKY